MKNLIEYYRKKSISRLFKTKGFEIAWEKWNPVVTSFLSSPPTASEVLDLGDHLKEIFNTTNEAGRSQASLSGGGANWEALVCYYLNLCLIGRRTVVVKHSKELLPTPISDAISVKYGNFISNTESDLIAITFPDEPEYTTKLDEPSISPILKYKTVSKKPKFDMIETLNTLTARDFDNIEIHIIQCKTNWNDNAQIPMLWDMIYFSKGFNNSVNVGQNNYDITDKITSTPPKFSYSFVTVPTVNVDKIKATSTCVKRVHHLSGGNYWGLPTKSSVANSLKEIFRNNLSTGHKHPLRKTLSNELKKLNSKYSYFNLDLDLDD